MSASVETGAHQTDRIYIELPFATKPAQWLMHIYVLVIYVLSGNILDTIGYDYGAITGSPVTKIHPSTYLIIITFAVFVATYPYKKNLLYFYLSERIGTLYFFCATTAALINIIVGKRNGFGMYIDTHLNLFLCVMMLPFMPPQLVRRCEYFLHWYFMLDAVVTIAQWVIGTSFFPLIVHSSQGDNIDARLTAFLGHPLHAATITACYVISLLCGGGKQLIGPLRWPMIVLQLTAMVPFGGRTALLVTLLAVLIVCALRIWQFVRGAKLSLAEAIATLLAPIVVAGTVGSLTVLGAFDRFLSRFTDDSGSARARLIMFDLLADMPWRDVIWGGETSAVVAIVTAHGLEWGVENPYVHMIVYQGGVMATFIVTGFIALLREVYLHLQRISIIPLLTFIALCNTFGSFGGRFYTFSIFIILLSAMFPREDRSGVY